MLQTLLAAAALSTALAQAPNDVGSEDQPEGSATVQPSPPARPPPATEQGADAQPARRDAANAQHTVVRGDTLWDLSSHYLGSPWYWPKVWSYNPEIANPHWIYPGNIVRFFQSGEEVPTQVEVGQGGQGVAEAPDVEEGAMVADEDRVVVTGQIGYRGKAAQNLILPALVTPGDVEGSGQIVGSFSERKMLIEPSTVYVRFTDGRTPRLGETYVVFRRGQELTHPVTGETVGFYTRVMGEVRVVRAEKGGVSTMQIVRSVDEIERGDLIGPSGEPLLRQVSARPNEREVLGGVIVSLAPPYRAVAGAHQVVIIDRGSEHGVKLGNTFTFWRQHDAITSNSFVNPTVIDPDLPRENVGSCIAADVKSRATVCLVSGTLRELYRGDRADVQIAVSRSARR